MAKKKRKGLGVFRTLIIILLLVLIVLVLVLIFKNGIKLEKEPIKEKEQTVEINQNEEVKISCNKYDVYFDDDDKLGFNFIIAELSFNNDNGNLYYDLSKLHTSEKISLDSVDFYLSKIQSYNFDISSFNLLDTQFTSEGGHLKGNVFIPVLANYNSISVFNGEEIKFDLTKNKHNINELLYDIQTEDIKTDKYDIIVSNSYLENTFITSDTGEEFPCPLALVFELYVKELTNSNVYIEAAKFIPEGALSGFSLDMIDDHVDSYKIQNVINKKLKTGDKYGLFFQVSEQTNTKGKIMIKFSDSDKWIELNAGE